MKKETKLIYCCGCHKTVIGVDEKDNGKWIEHFNSNAERVPCFMKPGMSYATGLCKECATR